MALGNKELQYLRMMLQNRPGVKKKFVVKEQDKELLRQIEGKIEVVECGEGEEGWYEATVGGFRLLSQATLDALCRKGEVILGLLETLMGKVLKTAPAAVIVDKKKTGKPMTIPVKQVTSGTFRPRLRKSEDYVILSDTFEGLGVPGSSSGAGGATAGTSPLVEQKRKGDTATAGESKMPAFRWPRAAVLSTHMLAVSVGGQKTEVPRLRKCPEIRCCGLGGEDQPSIQLTETELEYYYRTYSEVRGLNVHTPLWSILQGDDVMTNPSLCREALKGFRPHTEAVRLKAGGRERLYHQLALHLVGGFLVGNAILDDWSSLALREEETTRLNEEDAAAMKKVQAAEERLAKQKANFEAYKREQWAATAGHQQEINNLKAANAGLAKEKAAAEATMKEAEARREAAVKELADANVGRTRMAKIIEDLKEKSRKEVEARETILGDVNRRLEEAETRARQVAEEKDGLATMNAQLVADCAWMRDFVIAINTDAVAKVRECAREAGFKARYNECLTHVNALSATKVTDERCALRDVDTDATFRAATEAYDGLIVPALAQTEECLDADDYVDRPRTLFEPKKDGEGSSGVNVE
ncbi:hypothetical protein HanXRQr2_Chr16g0761381 [Helianthus annuus]|uniref:Uncharacterized protein n=1 Tax=Helianthus annuus TaxID=4232 RepID=A0A9K3DSY7_HELAN|nr:hypothetical protein HanXRQr2_Chr16g0761381 [Helianthus annuus]KAJ0439032.1 hypothetical protein HanHA300_Chr16g0620731 [Helianthus annuus]KAJ0443997.1 hypothetical protein HanIR_Chr16g0826941 [Helianthus annuus]KAJ0461391.1 hypothetical protein HanHA89_Chr16g0671691 [Helianthus annuus]KAJ0641815.1 hypothetical protein HanLR1_Chr16g0631351 [Helianthus annuus]